MSKLVIVTQHRENYGAHDWNGEGSCPQYWKMKGGNTYVVEQLSERSLDKIARDGIPQLSLLIESRGQYFEEYIIDWEIREDDATVTEEWESHITLSYDSESQNWCAERITDNTRSGGYLRREIQTQTEQFTLAPAGERTDYCNTYTMVSGEVLQYSELEQYFKQLEA